MTPCYYCEQPRGPKGECCQVVADREREAEAAELRAEIVGLWARVGLLETSLRRVIGKHFPPEDCYSTGPLHGDVRDEVCVACEALALLAVRE